MFNFFKKKLSPQDLKDLQELNRICFTYRFMADEVKKNTALVPDGQKLVKQLEGMFNIFDKAMEEHKSKKVREFDFPPNSHVSIDLNTGILTLLDGPINS